jgi:glutaredoxin
MFATSWCSHCTRARGFLDANGLRREERDVDHDPRARAELKRLTGEASVPVFLVDGELVKGFSEKGMTRVLVASVEKRLGVRGIRVRTAEGR